jgi:hypothetical protein
MNPRGTKPDVIYDGATCPTFPCTLVAVGATVTIDAPGTPEFPAFSATGIGPTTVAGYSLPTSLSRAAGYTATWTAGTGPRIRIQLIAYVSAGGMCSPPTYPCTRHAALECIVPDTGSFTITPEMFALLPAGDDFADVWIMRDGGMTVASPSVTVRVGHRIPLAQKIPMN